MPTRNHVECGRFSRIISGLPLKPKPMKRSSCQSQTERWFTWLEWLPRHICTSDAFVTIVWAQMWMPVIAAPAALYVSAHSSNGVISKSIVCTTSFRLSAKRGSFKWNKIQDSLKVDSDTFNPTGHSSSPSLVCPISCFDWNRQTNGRNTICFRIETIEQYSTIE